VVARAIAIVLVLAATSSRAQPGRVVDTSAQLRDANAAATAGDWGKVARLVDPLVDAQLAPADLAEAHRLSGLAYFFQDRHKDAEREWLAYLLLDPEGTLDPSLYPPEAGTYFDRVKSRHHAEILRARSAKTPQRAYWWLSWVPFVSQIQNRETKKAIVLGAILVPFAATDVIIYVTLHDNWCRNNPSCDNGGHSTHTARILQGILVGAIVGEVALALYAGSDGVVSYLRRRKRESLHAFVSPVSSGALVGLAGTW
jgi:hypothetical protein